MVNQTVNQLVTVALDDEGDDFVHEVVHEANRATVHVSVHEFDHVSVHYLLRLDHVVGGSMSHQLYRTLFGDVLYVQLVPLLIQHLTMVMYDGERCQAVFHGAMFHCEVEVNLLQYGHFCLADILYNWLRYTFS